MVALSFTAVVQTTISLKGSTKYVIIINLQHTHSIKTYRAAFYQLKSFRSVFTDFLILSLTIVERQTRHRIWDKIRYHSSPLPTQSLYMANTVSSELHFYAIKLQL